MKICFVIILSILGGTSTVSAAELPCSTAQNALEDTRCMSAEIDKADKTLHEYLQAAQGRLSRDQKKGLNLNAAQAEWSRYRTMHCGDVYDYWKEGTYRFHASAQCQIDLARSRTHDIWAAYLTFVDSTPALLPEPHIP